MEVFDEADLDAALARFDELSRETHRLGNAATQVYERFKTCFASRDWVGVAALLADDISTDDRRRVVNAGVQHGRDVNMADLQALAEVVIERMTSIVVATRGERLFLSRVCSWMRDGTRLETVAEVLSLIEIDGDNRIRAGVSFDLENIDAAFEELDARYLAGEAAEHAHAWSVIARECAAFNRRELPATTPDWIYIDHRSLIPIDSDDFSANMRAIRDLTPDISIRIETVHRLSSLGATVTYTACGTSQQGFDAEWRMIHLLMVDGDLISRCEMFDEADLDAALARFDELSQQAPLCANAATRTWARAADAFNRRDVDSFFALMTADGQFEDRRKGLRVVHEGPARRKAVHAVFDQAPSSWRMHAEPIAIRGSRLELTRECYCDTDEADRPIAVEFLHVMELGDGNKIQDIVSFDPDDIHGAFAELTARWIALGEVAYPDVVEAVDRINATINRHDWDSVATLFAGAEYVNHRQLAGAVDGTIADWLSSMRTTASLVPDLWVELAEVLSRSAIGIVSRSALKGTSTDGAAIEIPFVTVMLLNGERVTRLEAFDEDQRDMALARLRELSIEY